MRMKPIDPAPHVLAPIVLLKLDAGSLDISKWKANDTKEEEAENDQNHEGLMVVPELPRGFASRIGIIFCRHGFRNKCELPSSSLFSHADGKLH